MYEDKTLVCKECGQEFVFTAGEQEFYAERGFQNEPQRCKACRDARKAASVVPVSTSLLPALPAAARPGCPSSPSPTAPVYCSDCSPVCAASRTKRQTLRKDARNGRPFLLWMLQERNRF